MLTRASRLALAQATIAKNLLEAKNPQLEVKLLPTVTAGDQLQGNLTEHGGKELFVHKLHEELLAKNADCTCHSLKDLGHDNDEFNLAAFLPREDCRDALIGSTLNDLKAKANVVIATSSPRRIDQIKFQIPYAKTIAIRGNVDTRIKKLQDGIADALILAVAGLKRLELTKHITEILDTTNFTPAAGQGTIVLECLSGNKKMQEILNSVDDANARKMAICERSVIATIYGNCYTPIGVMAEIIAGQKIKLSSTLYSHFLKLSTKIIGEDPIQVGIAAANDLLENGGRELLAKINSKN